MTIKVAVDNGPLKSGHKVRGVGAYTKELIHALKLQRYGDIEVSAVDFGRMDVGKWIVDGKYDVVHYPYFHPFQKTLPSEFTPDQKVVVTVHDLIQLIYPNIYQPGVKGRMNFWYQRRQVKKVDAIIVPSVTSKKDVVRFLNVDPGKVHVIYEGVREIFTKTIDKKTLESIRRKYKLPDKFVLYVGDVNYNKNIPTLIKACLKIDIPLVICGKQALEVADAGINLMNLEGPRDYIRFLFNIPHPELKHYLELSDEFDKNRNKIFRLGFVEDNDLAAIYKLASVYVQPSFYEGFGLPVIEAFASGVPSVISKTNCLVEVAGESALTADAGNENDFSEKIKTILTNTKLKQRLVNAGTKRLKDFSWKKCAEETIDVYKKVAIQN